MTIASLEQSYHINKPDIHIVPSFSVINNTEIELNTNPNTEKYFHIKVNFTIPFQQLYFLFCVKEFKDHVIFYRKSVKSTTGLIDIKFQRYFGVNLNIEEVTRLHSTSNMGVLDDHISEKCVILHDFR